MHTVSTFAESIGTSAPVWVYFILFFISFLDTLIIIGAFFPASFFVITAGFFLFSSNLNLFLAILVVLVGGVIGDLLSYYLGIQGQGLFDNRPRLKKILYLHKGQEFFEKYGNKSIIFGRFLGVMKSVIPFIAGLSKMDLKKFIFLNIFSGVLWTIVHLGIGYILGKVFSYFYIPRDVKFMVAFLPFLFFFIWLLFEYRNKIFKISKFLKRTNKDLSEV